MAARALCVRERECVCVCTSLFFLPQHGQRVTGMDWAPKSDRLVTCGAVS